MEGAEGEDARPLNNTSSCHSGLDPESRKHLITLDTGLRRYDDGDGFFTIATPPPVWDKGPVISGVPLVSPFGAGAIMEKEETGE